MNGLWITFEGGEGSGKTTQLRRLAGKLREAGGPEVICTREPGGTALGARIRTILLDPGAVELDPAAELLLYTADRAQHLNEVILPALHAGAVILCDRYLDATLAYQGHGRGLDPERILALHRRPPLDARPHRTLLFDLDPVHGLDRARERDRRLGKEREEGRFEAEALEFHRRVRDGYLELAAAEPQRFRVIDAAGSPEEVEARVLSALSDLSALPSLPGSPDTPGTVGGRR